MADRLFTSKESDEILSMLRLETKLEFYVLARIAIALSLNKYKSSAKPVYDFSGKQFKRAQIIGQEELYYHTLLSYIYNRNDFDDDEFYSNNSFIKYHIDHGCLLLKELFIQSGNSRDIFLLKLAEIVKNNLPKEYNTKDLDLLIGKKELTNDDIIVELNNTSKFANSHLAITGKPGTGKTQFLLKLLADIRHQSNFLTNFILFDYKGDVSSNDNFVNITRSAVYTIPDVSLPINPFMLSAYDEASINISAREKTESFASINSKLGPVQKGNLQQAILAAYEKRKHLGQNYPDFDDVYEITRELYEADGRNDDTLIEILRDLSNFNLFWEHGSSQKLIDKLTSKTFIVNLSRLPVLKELVAYLVIERLYKEMASLPDSTIDDNRRTIKTVLVIDEAHNYLAQKNIFLQKIIREGRSKGVVVFFASQSPDDYTQEFFDFQQLLEFAFLFASDGLRPTAIQSILGCSAQTAKNLQIEIAGLIPFQAIAKGLAPTEEFIKFKAEAFYKNY